MTAMFTASRKIWKASARRRSPGRVELADLGRDIALEAADAEQQAEQGEQEADVERHQEMAGGHQQRADRDRPRPAQPAGRR